MKLSLVHVKSRFRKGWSTLANKLSGTEGTNAGRADFQKKVIKVYMDSLGAAADYGERSDLASACLDVLNGIGGNELQEMTLNTINWQSKQMSKVQAILDHLKQKRLLVALLDPEAIEICLKNLDGESRKLMLGAHDRFLKIRSVREILQPAEQNTIAILYQEAFNLLMDNVVSNNLLYPDRFDLEKVANETEKCLTEGDSPPVPSTPLLGEPGGAFDTERQSEIGDTNRLHGLSARRSVLDNPPQESPAQNDLELAFTLPGEERSQQEDRLEGGTA